MKVVKKLIILAMIFNFIVSCTVDEIDEERSPNSTENAQETGETEGQVDETEKG